MRILFAGSPEIAVPSLRKIAEVYPCAVLTGSDRRAGRGRTVVASPVKLTSSELGLRVITADRIDPAVMEEVRTFSADILAVAAYGRIFKKRFLDMFPLGGINLHPSLLPRYRGPSPVTAAILSGDAETGVTIQRIALEVDSGAILAQERVMLSGEETTESLSLRLGELGAGLMMRVLDGIRAGSIPETAQNPADATYCGLVKKEQGKIDWSEDAGRIARMVRAYDPWPRAYTYWQGLCLLVLKSREYTGTVTPEGEGIPAGGVMRCHPEHGLLVQTGKGVLAVERLQLQNKKALDWRSFVNGRPEIVGSRLGG
jgi:methionyl-tRNA formyltransferase